MVIIYIGNLESLEGEGEQKPYNLIKLCEQR